MDTVKVLYYHLIKFIFNMTFKIVIIIIEKTIMHENT